MQFFFVLRCLGGTFLGLSGTIQNEGFRGFVLTRTHQYQFDLVLDVFNVQGATRGHTAQIGRLDHVSEAFTHFAHASAARCLSTFNGEKRLGDGDRYLGAIKRYYNAITLDNAKRAGADVGALVNLRCAVIKG